MPAELPLISVVTVCFNVRNDIERTIRSVIAQTYPRLEFIVVDGGSTDGTLDVIERYRGHINRLISEPDKGIFDAMNKGIAAATGEYVNFMNAGDRFFEPESVMKVMERSARRADFIAAASYLSSSGKSPKVWEPVRKNFTYSDVIDGGACNHQSCFIRSSVFDAGGYPLHYGVIGDLLFFLDKTLYGTSTYEPVYVPAVIYDANGVSSDPAMSDRLSRLRAAYRRAHEGDAVNPQRLDRSRFETFMARKMRNLKRRYYALRYRSAWAGRREF